MMPGQTKIFDDESFDLMSADYNNPSFNSYTEGKGKDLGNPNELSEVTLRITNIPQGLEKQVLNDIGKIMLNQRCLDELFKPQEVYNRQALKTLFHDLAHASIMRLNEISMDKLFDLMIMVFKYQLVQCSKPQDLLLITLNHLDSIRYLLTTPFCHKQLDVTYFMLIKTYSQVTSGDLQNIRFHLLSFFQDIRIRVSLFLRQGLQNNDGGFIISTNYTLPYEYEVPGSIRLYNSEGCICDLLNFSPGGKYTQAPEPSSLELRGKRCTTLGTNVYSAIKPHKKEDENFWSTCDSVSSEQWHFTDTDCGLREELNLLIKQLGNRQDTQGEGSLSSVTTFNLFEEDTDPTRCQAKRSDQMLSLPTKEPLHSATLKNVMTEMSEIESGIEENLKNKDLIELMNELDPT